MVEPAQTPFSIGTEKVVFIPTVSICAPGTFYECIHNDDEFKIMSSIFYISSKGTGTLLYDKNKKFYEEVTWRKGKGYSFIPTKSSWHNYKNDTDELRIALIINMTTRKRFPKRYK